MNNVPNTDTIINVAIISQYLFTRDILNNNFYGANPIDRKRPRLLYNIRKSVQRVYALNPSDASLIKTGEYLFGLCEPHTQSALTIISNSTQLPPVITGPTNQSVNVGQNATFSVSVVSALPVTYQWYDYLGNPIPLATSSSYIFMNAQLADSGKTFFVRATNAVGSVVSSTASLTVNALITGFLSYGDIDPAAALQSSNDPFTYQNSFSITHNASLSITIPAPATPNKYLIVKVPDTESIKNTWFNTALNNGTIPDFNWQDHVQFGGNTYYYSRQALTMDPSQPLILSAV
jgi:hypothetical protein